MPHQNSAESFELFGGIEVERVAHDAKRCVIHGERDSVAVKDFASWGGESNQPESVAVCEAYIFVALVDLAEV